MRAGLTDAHLHFDGYVEDGTLEEVLVRAAEVGVERMVASGGTEEANRRVAELVTNHPGRIYGAVGFDRDEAVRAPDEASLRPWIETPGVVAMGETGLDYHYSAETAAQQRALFSRMLAVAAEHCLPTVIHSRDADEDTLALLRAHRAAWRGDTDRLAVLHCFTGSKSFARRLLDVGIWISFSGILTFKKADALREVARMVPEDRLLIETDAPYLAPVPHRGKRNEPAFVRHVAEAMAQIRDDTVSHIADITSRNAARLFGFPQE